MAPKRKEEGRKKERRRKKEGRKEEMKKEGRRKEEGIKNFQNFHQQQQPTKNQIIQWCQS
jgi:hypothetical protein